MHPNTLRALPKHLGTLQFEPPKSKLTTVQTSIVLWWLETFGKQSVVGCWVVWTYVVQRWFNATLRRCLGNAPLVRSVYFWKIPKEVIWKALNTQCIFLHIWKHVSASNFHSFFPMHQFSCKGLHFIIEVRDVLCEEKHCPSAICAHLNIKNVKM